jgi:hypothetical protein
MASKKFRSTTGYPVTVYAPDASGNSAQIRVDSEEPFETDDKDTIEALQGVADVEEVKGSSQKADKEKDDAS